MPATSSRCFPSGSNNRAELTGSTNSQASGTDTNGIGDERAGAIVDILREYLRRADRLALEAPQANSSNQTKEKPPPVSQRGFLVESLAVTYSGMPERHTTIGAERFHFRVRNGIGWFPLAMAARQTV